MTAYGALLLLLCSLDLLSTTIASELVSRPENSFSEYNYILRYYYDCGGIYGLILMKIFLTLCCLFLLEQAGRRLGADTAKFEIVYGFGIALYVVFYLSGIILANQAFI